MRLLFACLFSAAALSAAYTNLIATADGNAVYFQVATGPATNAWYVVRAGGSVEPVSRNLADVSATGIVQAWSTFAPRSCGFAGSSCWLADWCQASFGIVSPAANPGNSGYQTSVRLDAGGGLAWIDQSSCHSIGWSGQAPPLSGLYEAATLHPVAPSGGAKLANQRYGRRVITTAGRALTLAGPQLQWLDASGAHPIRNVYGAEEAVADAVGANVVYVEPESGELHWLTGPDWLGARDQDLHAQGSAPAITPDGSAVLFLAGDSTLQLYDRSTGAIRALTAEHYVAFTTATGTVFAVTADGRLVRIELNSGTSAEWLAPFPGIQSIGAASRSNFVVTCPYICYSVEDHGMFVDRGMLVVLHGDSMGQSGWRVKSAGVETALIPISDSTAWFQVPDNLPQTGDVQTLEIYRPDHPLRYDMLIAIQSGIPVCLGIAHQDFTHTVTAADPPVMGEVIHAFITGLQVPGPVPELHEPGAFDVVFFGAAPGLAGMQQLDLRVLGASDGIFKTPYAVHCDW